MPSEAPSVRAEKLTGRDYISYSALRLYQMCPLRFYFRYVAGLPEPTVAASLVLGGAIHAAVEYHFRELLAGGAPPDLPALLEVYQQAWQERAGAEVQFGKDDAAALHQLAKRMLETFHSSDFARPTGTIIGVEEELRGELVSGVPDLLARVDLLIDDGERLVVTDLKTARSRWGQAQIEDSAEQLLLYSTLASRLLPGKQVALQFAVITKAKEPMVDCHPVAVDSRRIERTTKIVERVWRAIEARHFYPAPSPMNCPGCPYRKPCRAWRG